jgi:hypothetical protein
VVLEFFSGKFRWLVFASAKIGHERDHILKRLGRRLLARLR